MGSKRDAKENNVAKNKLDVQGMEPALTLSLTQSEKCTFKTDLNSI